MAQASMIKEPSSQLEVPTDDEQQSPDRLTIHEASRVKKAVEANAKSIENRIRFFKREEEKIWRDLEEVRRQAATIEEGRSRALERQIAAKVIEKARTQELQQNKERAALQRQHKAEYLQTKAETSGQTQKHMNGQEQRKLSQDILRQKRILDAQVRLQNFERAVAIQRAQLESKLRTNSEKEQRLERLKEEQEAERLAAELEVQRAESKLPSLEAEEMVCLQRLQNSRIVTQSVLEELESSLGSRSSVTNLLRAKQKASQENFDRLGDQRHSTSVGSASPPKGSGSCAGRPPPRAMLDTRKSLPGGYPQSS